MRISDWSSDVCSSDLSKGSWSSADLPLDVVAHDPVQRLSFGADARWVEAVGAAEIVVCRLAGDARLAVVGVAAPGAGGGGHEAAHLPASLAMSCARSSAWSCAARSSTRPHSRHQTG